MLISSFSGSFRFRWDICAVASKWEQPSYLLSECFWRQPTKTPLCHNRVILRHTHCHNDDFRQVNMMYFQFYNSDEILVQWLANEPNPPISEWTIDNQPIPHYATTGAFWGTFSCPKCLQENGKLEVFFSRWPTDIPLCLNWGILRHIYLPKVLGKLETTNSNLAMPQVQEKPRG